MAYRFVDVWIERTADDVRLVDRDGQYLCSVSRLDDLLPLAASALLYRGQAREVDEIVIRNEQGEVVARDSVGRACVRYRVAETPRSRPMQRKCIEHSRPRKQAPRKAHHAIEHPTR